MKTKRIYTLMVAIAVMLIAQTTADACTGIKLTTKDGSTVHGRTLEFGVEVATSVAVVPKNYQFTGQTDHGDGMKYKSKYAYTGVITFDILNVADGMNDAGLSCGAFYFPTIAEYATLTKENQNKALSPLDFNNWVLAQFATVDELRNAIENKEVVIVPTVLDGWGPTAPPDRKSVV